MLILYFELINYSLRQDSLHGAVEMSDMEARQQRKKMEDVPSWFMTFLQ